MSPIGRRVAAVVALVAAAFALTATPASAQTGPSVVPTRQQVRPGEVLIVSLSGFKSSFVTLTVCGNLAKRGSADCDMRGSKTDSIKSTKGVTLSELAVSAPPMPCPCIVRASSATQGEFGVTPIEIVGHPVAPVVDTYPGPLVEVTVDARHRPAGFGGWLRSALGGPAPYDVAVTVRNITTDPLSKVVVRGSATHRLDDDAGTLQFPPVPPLGPGQTWSHEQRSVVHAPSLGRYTWDVAVLGAGPKVTSTQDTDRLPIALLVLGVVLFADVAVIVWRRLRRRPTGNEAEVAAVARVAAGEAQRGQVSSARGSRALRFRRIMAVAGAKPTRS